MTRLSGQEPVSRRAALARIGRAGGPGVLAAAMQGLGLFSTSTANARPIPKLPADFGAGARVIVLGAGVAGLVAAWELEQAGLCRHTA